MAQAPTAQANLSIGPSAIAAYSRLSYSMWYALAEFIDNSTQSRANYASTMDGVLQSEGKPLIVEIDYDRINRQISVKDNSIGMSKEDLIAALHIAHPTPDSRGRSKYGMGMKTAACWIGRKWEVTTAEYGSGEQWTARVDVDAVARGDTRIPLSLKSVAKTAHYTKISISGLHRTIQRSTEETIRGYLGSMYRFDILDGSLTITYGGDAVPPPDDYLFDTDPEGHLMRREIPSTQINGKTVSGWVGVLRKGGRKYGGFSLFQHRRQIQGYPNAWKPKRIFGGIEDEGANNLVSQRLIGLIELSGFSLSHTKDTVLFEDDEQEELEDLLDKLTRDYREYAQRRRGTRGQPWSKEKLRDLLQDMKREFDSSEMRDTVSNAILPPIGTIVQNNQQQLASITDADIMARLDILPDLHIVVCVQEKSEYEPHLVLVAGADLGTIYVLINGLHPYYCALTSTEAVDECIRQYIFDAVAEFRVSRLIGRVNPDSVRRLKNDLLRAPVFRIENSARDEQDAELDGGAA